jgi:hypothetical protein
VSQWKYSALRALPDSVCRRVLYRRLVGAWPNQREPRTFNEKVNWRVLNDRREDLVWTCDKLLMKEHARRVEGLRVPDTLWSGTDLRELAELDLPDRWVLKPNNGSGKVHLGVGRLGPPDVAALLRLTKGWLDPWQSRYLREWAYRRARPVFLVEEFVGTGEDLLPADYKFHVFDGVLGFVQVDVARAPLDPQRRVYVSPDWDLIDVVIGAPPAPWPLERPPLLERMVAVALEIAQGFDFLRVDLYAPGDEIWFGEVAPYPASGLVPITPSSVDERWGELWTLPLRTGRSGRVVGGAS